jgi:hypothetical protein
VFGRSVPFKLMTSLIVTTAMEDTIEVRGQEDTDEGKQQ